MSTRAIYITKTFLYISQLNAWIARRPLKRLWCLFNAVHNRITRARLNHCKLYSEYVIYDRGQVTKMQAWTIHKEVQDIASLIYVKRFPNFYGPRMASDCITLFFICPKFSKISSAPVWRKFVTVTQGACLYVGPPVNDGSSFLVAVASMHVATVPARGRLKQVDESVNAECPICSM